MHSQWRGALEWGKQGLQLSTASQEACQMYDAVVTQYTGWYDDQNLGGIEGTLARLRAADPEFVMGHVLANGLELLGTSRSVQLDASLDEDLKTMLRLANNQTKLTARERKHVAAIELWSKGCLKQACLVWEEILLEHPHDVLALKFAHDTYFYLGHSTQIRDSVARVLPFWKPKYHLYGYLLGMHSFGLEETNLYAEAEAEARKGLSFNPRDAWSTHTLCHVMEMTGRQHEGIYMMQTTSNYWTTCGMLACHNNWHLALYYIELGNYEAALSLFDTEIMARAVKSGAMLDIVDACSLLYRLEMEDVDVGSRWDTAYDVCKTHLHDNILAFNDLHILMSCLGAKRKEAVTELMQSIQSYMSNGEGTNKNVTAEIGEKLCQAFVAYDDGDFASSVDLIWPMKYDVIKLGGSHAQRDLINLFVIQAAIKSHKKEHHKLARALINERKMWKPKSPLTDRLHSKVLTL